MITSKYKEASMNIKSSFLILVIFSLVGITGIYTQDSKEQYKLISKIAEGQKWQIKLESCIDVDIIAKDASGVKSPSTHSVIRKDTFIQEIKEAKNGDPKTMEVKYSSSTKEESGSGIMPKGAVKTILDGKTFTLKVKDGEFEVTCEDKNSNIPKEELRTLGRWNNYIALLPDKEVKADDSWSVGIDNIVKLIYDLEGAKYDSDTKCKLKEVKDRKATLALSGNINGKVKQNDTFKIEFTSEIIFDINKGVPATIQFNGKLNLEKKQVEKGKTIGEITITSRKLEMTISFEEAK